MFLINYYIYITILSLSLIASLTVYFQKNQPLYLKLFTPFLLFTLGVEVAAHILISKGIDNSYLYHYFFPLEFVFYLYVAYNIISRKKIKRAIIVSTLAYIISICIYYTQVKMEGFPTIAYCSGALLLIFFYATYFFDLMELPIHLTPKREESFWIFFGVMLYYSTTLPIWLTIRFMDPFSEGTLTYISTLLMLMNYGLYVSFIMAFICKSIFKKKSEPICNFDEFSQFLQNDKQNSSFS